MPHQLQGPNPFANLFPGDVNQQGLGAMLGPNFPALGAVPQGLAPSPAAQIPVIQQLFNLLAAARGGVPGGQPLGVQPPGVLPTAVQTPLALPGAQAPTAQAPTAAPGIAAAQQPRVPPIQPARPAQSVRPAPQPGGSPLTPGIPAIRPLRR